jgi:hypothetical protein
MLRTQLHQLIQFSCTTCKVTTYNNEGTTDRLSLHCRLELGYVQKTGFILFLHCKFLLPY